MPKNTSSRKKIGLIYGPAKCGKTTRMIDRYLEYARDIAASRVLFLVPTARQASEIRIKALQDPDVPGLLSPKIMEFHHLAQFLLERSPEATREISQFAKSFILSDIIQEMTAKQSLSYFSPIAESNGFAEEIGNFISELKKSEIRPADFSKAIEKKGASAKDKELAKIYQEYQDRLISHKVYDSEGRLWEAAELLERSGTSLLSDVELLIVDGFNSFTPSEFRIFKSLAERIPQALITLTYEKREDRKELFEVVARTYATLQENFQLDEECIERSTGTPGELAWIEEHVFSSQNEERILWNTDPTASEKIPPLHVVSTPGRSTEIEEIAREIKRLNIEHQVPLEEIAVILRNPESYRDIIQDIFTEFRIPHHIAANGKLLDNPVVRTLVSVFDIVESNFERETVLKFVKSMPVDFATIDPTSTHLTADQVDSAARLCHIFQGQHQWSSRIETRINQIQNKLDREASNDSNNPEAAEKRIRLAAKQQELKAVKTFLAALFERLENIPSRGTLADFANHFRQLISELGVADWIKKYEGPDEHKRDTMALDSLNKLLQELIRAASLLSASRKETTRSEFAARLRLMCLSEELHTATSQEGKVSVLEALKARQLSFRATFIPGLLEREFPFLHPQNVLYLDDERVELSRHGAELPQRRARLQEEMLIFYTSLATAREQLYLSYPLTDEQGHETLPSYFVDEVTSLFAQETVDEKAVSLARISPPLDELATRPEILTATLDLLWSPDGKHNGASKALYNVLQSAGDNVLWHAVVSSQMEAERLSDRSFSRFDGVIADKVAANKISERFGKNRLFSTSMINEYGTCPFMFFCHRVLGIEPPEKLSEEIAAPDSGSILHEVLWTFFTRLRDEGGELIHLPATHAQELSQRMDSAVEEVLSRHDNNPFLSSLALWPLEKKNIGKWLQKILHHEIDRREAGKLLGTPTHFEICFGMAPDEEPRDAASTCDPLTIDNDGDPIKLRGKIDRIDISAESDPPTFNVIDYKRTSIPSIQEIREGTDLQVPIYMIAAERVLFANRGLLPATGYAFSIRGVKSKAEVRNRDVPVPSDRQRPMPWQEALEKTESFIRSYVADIRQGCFPVTPRKGCPQYCKFGSACRYSAARMENKLNADTE